MTTHATYDNQMWTNKDLYCKDISINSSMPLRLNTPGIDKQCMCLP